MNEQHGWLMGVHAVLLLMANYGCESPKEPVLKVETPHTRIEVDKSPTGASVEVETAKPAEAPERP